MEEAVASIRGGQACDVAVIENPFIPELAAEGLLAELDHRNIPNLVHLAEDFRELLFDPGNRYSVTFNWGLTGLVVRDDLARGRVTRWADLWDERFAGRVQIWDLQRTLVGIALKSLGYSANSEHPDELEAALARLCNSRPGHGPRAMPRTLPSRPWSTAGPASCTGTPRICCWPQSRFPRFPSSSPRRVPFSGPVISSFLRPAQTNTWPSASSTSCSGRKSTRIVNEQHYPTASKAATPFIRGSSTISPLPAGPRDAPRRGAHATEPGRPAAACPTLAPVSGRAGTVGGTLGKPRWPRSAEPFTVQKSARQGSLRRQVIGLFAATVLVLLVFGLGAVLLLVRFTEQQGWSEAPAGGHPAGSCSRQQHPRAAAEPAAHGRSLRSQRPGHPHQATAPAPREQVLILEVVLVSARGEVHNPARRAPTTCSPTCSPSTSRNGSRSPQQGANTWAMCVCRPPTRPPGVCRAGTAGPGGGQPVAPGVFSRNPGRFPVGQGWHGLSGQPRGTDPRPFRHQSGQRYTAHRQPGTARPDPFGQTFLARQLPQRTGLGHAWWRPPSSRWPAHPGWP